MGIGNLTARAAEISIIIKVSCRIIYVPEIHSLFNTFLQRYSQTKDQLLNIDLLDQHYVDRALNSGMSELHESPELPKGIDGLTLEKVQYIFSVRQDSTLNSEEVS